MNTEGEELPHDEELIGLEFAGKEKRATWSKSRVVLVLCGVFLVTLLLVMAALEVAIVVLLAVDSQATPAAVVVPVSTTTSPVSQYSKEYQLSLKTDDWEDREAMLSEMAADFSGFATLNRTMASESVREQWGGSLKNCGGKEYLRFRKYVAGDRTGDLEMTLKLNGKKACEKNTMQVAAFPPFNWVTADRLKCEEDIHTCSSKLSVESRLMLTHELDSFPSISTCADVALFWPQGLQKMKEKHLGGEVAILGKKEQIWWVLTYKGNLTAFPDTEYEVSVTIKYSHLENALDGDSPHSGSEWSLKLLSKEGGTSPEYDEEAVAAMEALFETLIPKYDKMKDMDEEGNCV